MTGDELAAVALALQSLRPSEPQTQLPAMSAWKRSMLEPDLDMEALRAVARGERHVS